MKASQLKSVPLIGITCSRLIGGAWSNLSKGHFLDYTPEEYPQAIMSAGGSAVLLPVDQNVKNLAAVLTHLDGLILSGGPDVHPRFYGQEPLPGLGAVDEPLDHYALTTAKLAVKMDLPLLAICRGIQVLNVALGGTLYQDIERQVPAALSHSPSCDKGVLTHTVNIAAGTKLYGLLKSKKVWVNSKHHQAVKDLGKELVVSALASDGIIEALELPGKRFVIGVQWHPEGTWSSDRYAKKLFQALVQAARA